MPTPYYEHAGITIYLGDCREVLPTVTADVLITDPPYGISYSSGYSGDVWAGGVYGDAADGSIAGDADTSLRDAVLKLWGDRPALVFGSLRAPLPGKWRQCLVWDKGDASGMGDLCIPWKPNWEPIFVLGNWNGKGRSSGVLRSNNISRVCMGRCHPHMKPVALLEMLIAKCCGVVIDPFMGSGTTLRAAKNLGRRAIGIEIEENYCEIAAKRLSQEVLFPAEITS